METKRCTKCGELLSLSSFSKHKLMKDGFSSRCKTCRAEDGKKYRETHKSIIYLQQKRWAENNRDKRRSAVNRCYFRHKEEYAQKKRDSWNKYYHINIEKMKEYRRLHSIDSCVHKKLKRLGLNEKYFTIDFIENEKRLVALRRKLRQLKEAQSG